MALFDWFRKRASSVSLPQLCYDVAYHVLPHYAFNDIAKVADLCLNSPTAAGPFFYVMACQMREIEPVTEDAKSFHWHHGDLGGDREYFALEYPTPPPVDMSDLPPDQLINPSTPLVLAPYFSAVIRERVEGAGRYYILGQAPFGGGTTLRTITAIANGNLGPGPDPNLGAFLDAVRDCVASA